MQKKQQTNKLKVTSYKLFIWKCKQHVKKMINEKKLDVIWWVIKFKIECDGNEEKWLEAKHIIRMNPLQCIHA